MPRSAASVPYAARALVLRTRPLGEKDRICVLFSPERGRIDAVAKGARGPKSKLAALAQPFVVARFLLVTGRSLHIISQAEIETTHNGLAASIFATAWAYFVLEVAHTIPEGLPDERGFEIIIVALNALENAPDDDAREAAGIWFEIQWLAHQGFAPTVGFCVECARRISVPASDQSGKNARIWFAPNLGGTLCDECKHRDGGALLTSAASLRALHRLERSNRAPNSLSEAPFGLDAEASAELGRCVRLSTLSHIAPRFKSLPFLEELRAARRLKISAPEVAPESEQNVAQISSELQL